MCIRSIACFGGLRLLIHAVDTACLKLWPSPAPTPSSHPRTTVETYSTRRYARPNRDAHAWTTSSSSSRLPPHAIVSQRSHLTGGLTAPTSDEFLQNRAALLCLPLVTTRKRSNARHTLPSHQQTVAFRKPPTASHIQHQFPRSKIRGTLLLTRRRPSP